MIIAGAQRVRADHRLRARSRSVAKEIGAKFVVDMAHFAGLVATGFHPSPVPHADVVHDAPRTRPCAARAAGSILCKERAREGDRQGGVPGHPGRAARAHHRREGGRVQEALDPSFKQYCGQIVRERAGAGQRADRAAASTSSPVGPTTT